MWIFTPKGFVSVVRTDPATDISGQPYVVRARDRESLAALFPEEKAVETPLGDYRWRTFVTKMELSIALMAMLNDIDYTNFKDRVHSTSSGNLKRDMEFGLLCNHVWLEAASFQDSLHLPNAPLYQGTQTGRYVAKAPTTRPAQTEDYRSRKKPTKAKRKRPPNMGGHTFPFSEF